MGAARLTDSFNWGYDPYHHGVPEGSYSTNPDGITRILEFRDMVSALNQSGLRVVMDVVYNHTAASGQGNKSVLDKVVPGYYHRYDAVGALYMSSCCDDTATEYEMMEKLMIDTIVRFATAYKVDGFRFDLMNLHTRQNMLNLKTAVQAVDPTIYLYGEGWDFGSAKDKGLTTCPHCYAQKYNMTGAGIGLFNDIIHDAAHGGYSTDTVQIRRQGFINGLSTIGTATATPTAIRATCGPPPTNCARRCAAAARTGTARARPSPTTPRRRSTTSRSTTTRPSSTRTSLSCPTATAAATPAGSAAASLPPVWPTACAARTWA
ncbi:MAG: hypothetical protein ACUVR4_09015 [Anaerolineae bacterium]